MKTILAILILLSLSACQQNPAIETEKLELILLGLPQDFDTANLSKAGSQKYFCYNNSDSIVVKSCTYLDEKTGEPILPVKCTYYKKAVTPTQKSQFNFFIKYIKHLENGELIKSRPDETYCDLFGGWIAIYTDKYNQKKYFVFDCYGLPDSIHKLCNDLIFCDLDSTNSIRTIDVINTDSIVGSTYKILKNDFIRRESKNRSLKFISPE